MKISFSYYPEGKKKALTMSYDDGQVHDRRLVEIFNRYGIKGTFHLNSGLFDTGPYLSAAEISDLFKGHEISAHSLDHPFLTKIPNEVLVDEIREDRRRLEALAGYPVRGMSYPYGVYNDELIRLLPSLGIEYSRTVKAHGRFGLPEDFLAWHPTCHHNNNLMDRCRDFQNPRPWDEMLLFYVWGHSFEFDRNGNWDLMEEFCSTVSNDNSVWYATNIQIMDYLKALKSLKFGVDLWFVFNPSCIPVWIGVEGEPVKINPGETLYI